MSLALASYKLRFHEEHVRAVPRRDSSGCAFEGPGVDIRGDEARAILRAAAPMRDWLVLREPDIVLRSLSLSRGARGEALRVLVTLQPTAGGDRPRVVRVDPPFAEELAVAGAPAEALVVAACEAALRRRAQPR